LTGSFRARTARRFVGGSWTNFGLKQYDQAIDWARRAIAIGPNNPFPQAVLTAALALTGHEAETREALQHYVALPSSFAASDDRGVEDVRSAVHQCEYRSARPRK
jgi:hypothetical protein